MFNKNMNIAMNSDRDYLYFTSEDNMITYTIEKAGGVYYLYRTDRDKSFDDRLDKEVMIMYDNNIMKLIDYVLKDR